MSETEPAYGAGTVAIELDSKTTVVLKASLENILAISRLGPGLVLVKQRCGYLEFDMVSKVIEVAAGYTANGMKHLQIPEKIFAAGVDPVAVKVIDYLKGLENGGRLTEAASDESADPTSKAGA
jgi:hypothetical protein